MLEKEARRGVGKRAAARGTRFGRRKRQRYTFIVLAMFRIYRGGLYIERGYTWPPTRRGAVYTAHIHTRGKKHSKKLPQQKD